MLLLGDDFEEFSAICIANFGLDPVHSGSSLTLSWDAMICTTNCTQERISDP